MRDIPFDALTRKDDQIPANLVAVLIPGLEQYMTDIDVPVYVNLSTAAMSLAPLVAGTGEIVVQFRPQEGLKVPKIEMADTALMSNLSIQLNDTPKFWKRRNITGDYRNAVVTIWQGNIDRDGSLAPTVATFGGAVVAWRGQLDQVIYLNRHATLNVTPPRPFTAQIGRRYTADKYRMAPQPGQVDRWGFSEVQL